MYRRKYGVASTVFFALEAPDSSDFVTGVTLASGDARVWVDGVLQAIGATIVEVGGGLYSYALSVGELTGKTIILKLSDLTTGSKEWKDTFVLIETVGHVDARHPFDISDAGAGLGLEKLMKAAIAGSDVVDNSALAKLVSKSATADWDDYVNTTDSLQAIRDIAVGQIFDWEEPIIPDPIDLGPATHRISIAVKDSLGGLPVAANITAGTIEISRRARGASSWVVIEENDTPMSKADGQVYYDTTFSAGDGYLDDDRIRIRFFGQKVTVGGVDFVFQPATGTVTDYYVTMAGLSSGSPWNATQRDALLADAATAAASASATETQTQSAYLSGLIAAELNAYDAPKKSEMDTAQAAIVAAISASESNIAADIAALPPSTAAIASAVWSAVQEGSLTATQVLQVLLAASAGTLTAPAPGAGGAVSIKSPVTPSTVRIAATVDTIGQRSATQINP